MSKTFLRRIARMASLSEVELVVVAADDRLFRPPCFGTTAAVVAPEPAAEEEQQRTKGIYDLEVRGGEEEAKWKR